MRPPRSRDIAGAANRFGIEVTGGGNPRVYGEGLMAAYNNLPAGTQLFYLAQIDVRNAGKTAVISLYDPGDVGGGAWLRIMSPDGSVYNPAQMTWTSVSKADGSAGPSGSGTCIQTNDASHSNSPPAGCTNNQGGGSNFDGQWLTINVAIPQGYGTVVPSGGFAAGADAPWRTRTWLVEDRVHRQRRQRHDDLAGQHPRQPGPPRRSVSQPIAKKPGKPGLAARLLHATRRLARTHLVPRSWGRRSTKVFPH